MQDLVATGVKATAGLIIGCWVVAACGQAIGDGANSSVETRAVPSEPPPTSLPSGSTTNSPSPIAMPSSDRLNTAGWFRLGGKSPLGSGWLRRFPAPLDGYQLLWLPVQAHDEITARLLRGQEQVAHITWRHTVAGEPLFWDLHLVDVAVSDDALDKPLAVVLSSSVTELGQQWSELPVARQHLPSVAVEQLPDGRRLRPLSAD